MERGRRTKRERKREREREREGQDSGRHSGVRRCRWPSECVPGQAWRVRQRTDLSSAICAGQDGRRRGGEGVVACAPRAVLQVLLWLRVRLLLCGLPASHGAGRQTLACAHRRRASNSSKQRLRKQAEEQQQHGCEGKGQEVHGAEGRWHGNVRGKQEWLPVPATEAVDCAPRHAGARVCSRVAWRSSEVAAEAERLQKRGTRLDRTVDTNSKGGADGRGVQVSSLRAVELS